MGYNMEDAINEVMNDFYGSNPSRSHYSSEQIDKARKRQKKHGGTFLENLEALGGNSSSMSQLDMNLDAIRKAAESTKDSLDSMIKELNSDIEKDKLDSMIKDVNANLEQDFGIKAEGIEEPMDNVKTLDAFVGIGDVIKENVYGQDAFVKKLVIAFKRPYVSERDDNDALNSIFITGPSCTGKHYALETLVGELGKRGVFKSGEVTTMNLALYPSAAEETLFLQDLYSAIKNPASVIVFENYENCHVSNLTKISELVISGECKLQDRYVMKNGQLISVANALAGDTVGSLTAKNKYLVFMSNKPIDKIAGAMGAPFVNALGDVCAADALDEESIKLISSKNEEKLIEKCSKQLGYTVSVDDPFREYVLSQTSKGRGLKGILDTYTSVLKALTEMRLERDDIETTDIKLIMENEAPVISAGEETITLESLLPSGYMGELEKIKEEMDNIVGLKEVKEYIFSLEEYYGVQKLRKESGLKAGEVNKHMIFTGNPGTGKTTIARIVSKYLKAIGVLSGGQLVEVSRADLVGRYAGHTAPLTNQVIKSAIGGVLFIDEAYSLHRGREDSFGLEAIDTLVKGMEDNRDDLVVILAGYSNEMEEFLKTNSGLKSRFPNIIDFPDYTAEELLAISHLTAKSKGYVIDKGAEEALLEFYAKVQATRPMDAGNGRLVRNKIEEAILNQSRRLVAEKDADMSLLVLMDFELSE